MESYKNILFDKNENYNKFSLSSARLENIEEKIVYRPRISGGLIFLIALFIIFGLFFLYINRNMERTLERFFPLIFTVYGLLLLVKCLATNYIISDENLKIKSGTREWSILFNNITRIEQRSINLFFRHGVAGGRQRAETAYKNILFITYYDSNNKQQIIMVSPKNQEEFVKCLLFRLDAVQ